MKFTVKEGSNTEPSYFSFSSEKAARKALPKLKEGCRVGEGTFALYDFDPRNGEGCAAILAGVRR